jgi:poly(A) polymerase
MGRSLMPIPTEQIDADAQKVVKRLTRSGFSAYLVGGCVRDLLLERKPKDFDVATSATPPEIKSLFRNCRIIGRRFRLAHIFFGSKIIETSTFRANPREVEEAMAAPGSVDGEPEVEIPPAELLIRRDNVFGTAEEDARRRDFTINGLFYDLDAEKVIDYVDGLPDLHRSTVRTIGDPDIRFREDPVRILRAIKFAARLGFSIEPATYQALLTHRSEISKCAPPRVLEEIYRLFRGGAARRSLELLEETAVLDVLIPRLAELLRDNHTLRTRLHATLDGIDAMVQGGDAPSNALILCAILAPSCANLLYEPDSDKEPRGDVMLEVWDEVQPLLESIRASRRDSEIVRQMLLAQRRMAPGRRRRGRPMSLVRRDWFPEALALLELMHPNADGEMGDEIARWHRLAREGHLEQPAAAPGDPAQPAAPGQRRRRRRGGRRRRRGGRGGGGGTPIDTIQA